MLARRDDPGTPDRSAGWVLNGKAVSQEALAQRTLLSRDRDNPAAAPLVAPFFWAAFTVTGQATSAPATSPPRAQADRAGPPRPDQGDRGRAAGRGDLLRQSVKLDKQEKAGLVAFLRQL